MFQFKQFSVDQSNCAMKINTDGVLLGALADGDKINNILDIGTGTGVIALMLAQRFGKANIDAVEIDELAAYTAASNFKNSVFNERLTAHHISFEDFFNTSLYIKYDLMVSNPPFYINSLHSPAEKKQLAKHADKSLFQHMLTGAAQHLSPHGTFWLVLPLQTAELVKSIAAGVGLYIAKIIHLRSFADKAPHREIVQLSFERNKKREEQLVIYESEGGYTHQYKKALKPFFTIF